MRLGCEWRHARKRWAENFSDFWEKQLVEVWLWARRVEILTLGEVSPAGGYGMRRTFVGSDGTVSIVKIVSLSLSLLVLKKTKSHKKVSKRFVPEQRKVVSVSGFLCIWTFYISVFWLCYRNLALSTPSAPAGLHLTFGARASPSTHNDLLSHYLWDTRFKPSLCINYWY